MESLSAGGNDDAAASVSQFISMDSSGKAIIWVTSQATSDTVGKHVFCYAFDLSSSNYNK